MPVSPARSAAFDVLRRVEGGAYASELLHSRQYGKLAAADHGLATELVLGVLRWRAALDENVSRFCAKPLAKLDLEVLIALRLAAYQLLFLDRIPKHAAVDQSVELVKRARKSSAASLVNAILRKLAETERAEAKVSPSGGGAGLARILAHPRWMVERWMQGYGWQTARKICEYDQSPPVTTIRLVDPGAEQELRREGIQVEAGFCLQSARRVRDGSVARSRILSEGRVVIQDEASQLVAMLVGRGRRILDCCAAPGGKTRILAGRNPDAGIVALELHEHRARLLRRTVQEKNVEVIQADVREFPAGAQFDRVLADVPCSGTGTLARNPEIKWKLKAEDLGDLQARQVAILVAAMRQVAPEGRLLYSTCSLEREENEEVVQKAVALEPSFRVRECQKELEGLYAEGELILKDWDSLLSGPYLRTIPGVHPCDGFLAAMLERTR